MNTLTVIYIMGAAAVGFIAGLVFELMLDARTIRDLQDQNRKLRLENTQLKRNEHVEIIEIKDDRAQPESYFTPF